MRTLAFRFFNVFGPRQAPGHAYAAVIPAFTHAALTGEPLTVHGDGTQSRDFTYVGTVTEVIVDAVERGVTCADAGQPGLRIADEPARGDRLAIVADIVGRQPLLRSRNHDGDRGLDAPRRRARHSQADNTLLRSLFPDVTPVPLDDGLRATVAWMRDTTSPCVLAPHPRERRTVYSRAPDVVWRLGPDRRARSTRRRPWLRPFRASSVRRACPFGESFWFGPACHGSPRVQRRERQ
jgi:dTDP-D-glucose 4,6-dehydratase